MKKAIAAWLKTVKLQWVLVGVFAYSAAMFSGVQFFLYPQFRRYQQVVDKQVGLDDTYINLISLDIEAAIDSINRQIEELQELRSSFRRRVLKSRSVNSILPVIDRYCAEAKMKVVKLEPLDRTTLVPPEYEKLYVKALLLGKYSSFLKLLQKFESNAEWILVEKLTIAPLEKGYFQRFNLVLTLLQEKEQL